MPPELFTVGHSTHPLDVFLKLLARHGIEALADVRRFPGSRKYPHFNRDGFASVLAAAGVEYRWFETLGGRRGTKGGATSTNLGLRNESFRNYADYMGTPEFREAVEQLLGLARHKLRVTTAADYLLPLSRLGFVIAAATGVLMFLPGANLISDRGSDPWKLALILIAGLNVLVFHRHNYRGVPSGTRTSRRPPPPESPRSSPSRRGPASPSQEGSWHTPDFPARGRRPHHPTRARRERLGYGRERHPPGSRRGTAAQGAAHAAPWALGSTRRVIVPRASRAAA